MIRTCSICKEECNQHNPGIIVTCPTTGEKIMFCQKCYKKHHKPNG